MFPTVHGVVSQGGKGVAPQPGGHDYELFQQLAPSGRVMLADLPINTLRAWTLDAAGTPSNAEVLVKTLLAGTITGNPFRVHLSVSGAAGSENGYAVDLLPSSFQLAKYVNGSKSEIGSSTSFTWDTGLWLWARLRKSGATLQAKMWLDGEDEPLAWTLEHEDASLASGAVGWGAFSRGRKYVAQVGVGVNGATAPSSAQALSADQFYTDFAGQEVGEPPTGWTAHWAATPAEVIDNVTPPDTDVPPVGWKSLWAQDIGWYIDAESHLGDSSLKVAFNANKRVGLAWVKHGVPASSSYEALTLAKATTTGADQLRAYLRMSGGAGGERAVYVNLLHDDSLKLRTYGGTLDQTTRMQLLADTWYWLRFREDDGVFRARAWPAGQSEPLYWMLEGSEAALPPGYVGLGGFSSAGDKFFDMFAYDPNGGTIPLLGDEPEPVSIATAFTDVGPSTLSSSLNNQYATEFTPNQTLTLHGVLLRSASSSVVARAIYVWRVDDQQLLASIDGATDARAATPNILDQPLTLEAGKAYRISYRGGSQYYAYDGFNVDPRISVNPQSFWVSGTGFPGGTTDRDMRGGIDLLFEG